METQLLGVAIPVKILTVGVQNKYQASCKVTSFIPSLKIAYLDFGLSWVCRSFLFAPFQSYGWMDHKYNNSVCHGA